MPLFGGVSQINLSLLSQSTSIRSELWVNTRERLYSERGFPYLLKGTHYSQLWISKHKTWPNSRLMLGQRRRRWASIKPLLGQRALSLVWHLTIVRHRMRKVISRSFFLAGSLIYEPSYVFSFQKHRTKPTHNHHPPVVLLAQFSLFVHKCGLKPHSFNFITPTKHETGTRQQPAQLKRPGLN